jgi:hypothetical protein
MSTTPSSRVPTARGPTGTFGVVSALGLGLGGLGTLGIWGCQSDACEGLRELDLPPEPEASATAPPQVLDGEWIGAGILELQFSKPLSPGTAPDPARFAVVGWAVQASDYSSGCSITTRYSGIGVGYYGFSPVADVWVAPEDPTLLRLRMSNLGADCRTINDAFGEGVTLVYADGGSAGEPLRDANGDLVPDIGPAWAIGPWEGCIGSGGGYYYYAPCGYSLNSSTTGQLPGFSRLAQIPCPT